MTESLKIFHPLFLLDNSYRVQIIKIFDFYQISSIRVSRILNIFSHNTVFEIRLSNLLARKLQN